MPSHADELATEWGTREREADSYRIVNLPIPEPLFIEAGSFDTLPDGRMAVGTRRGDIFLVSGISDQYPRPKYHRFAAGLDEVLGLDYENGVFYVTQQTEVTRITDTDNDRRADRFDTLSDVWGFNNYHEFATGSKFDRDGNLWVALCLSRSYESEELFRGWALKITPDGQLITGGTNRGCPVRGTKQNVLERIDWTGKTPFEIQEINAQPDGFLLTFTKPVDPATARQTDNSHLTTYTHIYRKAYGSPEVDHTTPTVERAEVLKGGRKVRLQVCGLVQGHVHDFDLTGLKSVDDEELVHVKAYYTLNEIPKATVGQESVPTPRKD